MLSLAWGLPCTSHGSEALGVPTAPPDKQKRRLNRMIQTPALGSRVEKGTRLDTRTKRETAGVADAGRAPAGHCHGREYTPDRQ